MLLSSAQPRLLPALPWTVVSLPGSHPGLHCLPLGTPTGVGGAKGSVWRASCCSFSETYLRQQVDRNVLPMSVHKGSVPPPGWHLGRGALGEPLRRGHGGSQEGGPVVWPGEGGCRVPTGSRGTRGSRPRSAGVCSPGPRVVPPFPRVSRTGCSPSVCRSRCERPGGFACKPADDLRPKPRSGSWELTFRSVGASGRPWPSEGKAPTCEAGSEPLLGRHGWVCAHLHTHTCVHVCTQVHAHACTHKTSAHTQTATLKQLSVRGLGDLEPHPRA